MSDSTLEIQKAIVAALKADATVAGFVGARIYDRPPQNPTYPYVSIGPVFGETWDTDIGLGWDARFDINTWSRAFGRVEAAQIMAAIKDVLHRSALNLDTQTSVLSLLERSTTRREEDGSSERGIQTFRVLTHE